MGPSSPDIAPPVPPPPVAPRPAEVVPPPPTAVAGIDVGTPSGAAPQTEGVQPAVAGAEVAGQAPAQPEASVAPPAESADHGVRQAVRELPKGDLEGMNPDQVANMLRSLAGRRTVRATEAKCDEIENKMGEKEARGEKLTKADKAELKIAKKDRAQARKLGRLIDQNKNKLLKSENPEDRAMGMDIERAMILYENSLMEQEISAREAQLRQENPSITPAEMGQDTTLQALSGKHSARHAENETILTEMSVERGKLVGKDGQPIPDRVVQGVQEVAEALSAPGTRLREGEIQQIQDNPMGALENMLDHTNMPANELLQRFADRGLIPAERIKGLEAWMEIDVAGDEEERKKALMKMLLMFEAVFAMMVIKSAGSEPQGR